MLRKKNRIIVIFLQKFNLGSAYNSNLASFQRLFAKRLLLNLVVTAIFCMGFRQGTTSYCACIYLLYFWSS